MNPLKRNVLLFGFFLAIPVGWAVASTLEGTVTDADGKSLKDAEIRIEGKEGASGAKVVKTNAKGHYVYRGPGNGTYNVILVVNGVVKASIANVKLDEGHGESLNFAIQKNSVKPSARGKHYVWVASQTGSNIGRWVEVDDRKDSSRGMDQRLQSAGSDYVRRLQEAGGEMAHQ